MLLHLSENCGYLQMFVINPRHFAWCLEYGVVEGAKNINCNDKHFWVGVRITVHLVLQNN